MKMLPLIQNNLGSDKVIQVMYSKAVIQRWAAANIMVRGARTGPHGGLLVYFAG